MPTSVTDSDLLVYKHWYGDARAAAARARRDAALRDKTARKYATVKGLYKAFESYTKALDDNMLVPIVQFMKDMDAKNQERNEKISALEARVAELEAKPPAVEYAGIFDEQKTYMSGQLVTHRGGLWLATSPKTNGTPGTEASGFRLVVKKGQA